MIEKGVSLFYSPPRTTRSTFRCPYPHLGSRRFSSSTIPSIVGPSRKVDICCLILSPGDKPPFIFSILSHISRSVVNSGFQPPPVRNHFICSKRDIFFFTFVLRLKPPDVER